MSMVNTNLKKDVYIYIYICIYIYISSEQRQNIIYDL